MPTILSFRRLLDVHFQQHKQVKFYCEALGLSEKRLNQTTSTVLGKTPKQVIDEYTVLEGKRLLAHSHLSVKEVAFKMGFEEPTNFAKHFRKHTGQSPQLFRTRVQQA